ncbi:MAG: sulfatase, partial [Deltaproteobacteria bacterium]|nr:sulfatase [Deltaproteobacteria bacterium]
MSECSHPSRRIVGGAVLACALAGILAGALELAWMRAMWQPSMAVAGGLPKTVPPILGLSVLACTIVGAVQGLTAWLFHRIARVLAKGPSSHPRWLAALCTVAMTPAISWACAQAFSGRRARMLPGRWLWITAAGVVLLGVTYGGVRVVLGVGKRLEQAGGKGRGSSLGAWLAGGLVLAGAMFLALDQRLLVHRYPFFHVALEVLTFLACELAVLAAVNAWPRWRKDRHRILTRGWLASTAFLAVSAGALSIGTLRSSDALALRALVYEHGSLSARFLDGARLLGVSMDGAPLLNPSNQEGPVARRVTGDFPRFPGADLVLITVDALRADHLGALGYGRGVSPNLDQLAQASAVFERAYAPVPHTSFSIASLLVGKHVHALARLGLMNGHESLADVLRRYRYKTAAFFPPAVFYVDGERFKAYEEQRYGFEYVRFEPFLEDEDATARTDQAIRFLETERPVRTFLWIHYFGPHEPYVLHPNLGWSTNGERAVDNYDGEIRWVDREIGRLLDYLRANRPRAIIAVTADHGEEFGDHGGAYHGTTLYDEQLRVPLILHVPGLPGRRVGSPVSTVDVFPTLLSLVDVPVSARARGTDLRPWLVPKNPEPEADLPPVFAEIDALKMVALGSEKLICDATRGFCRLFDLHIDPKETRDLARERPQRALELRAHLGTWMASHAGFERAAMDADPAQAARRAVLSRGQLGDREAVPSLVDVLVGKDVPRDDRLLAARAVAVLAVESAMASGPALGEPELTSLRRARPADPDPSVRAWINVALAVSGAADARAALEHLDPMVIADEPELPARAALAR